MNEKNKIHWVPVEMLRPHPDNPRKNLGDLTELANSIKENGIFQNLTVVPATDFDGYTVIIGHRRLAAAKEAGLQAVPCIFADMSPMDQLSTMLLENMQRSDLTIIEEAQGMQLMLDLGSDKDEIIEMTGLSETSVRRRLKIAELDKDKLAEVADRQITLADFDKLSQVESLDKRNEILSDIGTGNFGWKINNAIQVQNYEKKHEKWREIANGLGMTEIEEKDRYTGEYRYRGGHSQDVSKSQLDKIVENIGVPAEELFYFCNFGGINVYSKPSEKKESGNTEQEKLRIASEQKKQEENNRREKVNKLMNNAREARMSFIRELHESVMEAYLPHIVRRLFDYLEENSEMYCDVITMTMKKDSYEEAVEAFRELIENKPIKSLIILIAAIVDYNSFSPSDWMGKYDEDEAECVKEYYSFLERLGYDIPDEIRGLLDGTHEIYGGNQE